MPQYIDADGLEFETENPLLMRFIEDMEAADIPWHVYSGKFMYGRTCPAVYLNDELDQLDIADMTDVRGFVFDSMGLGRVMYLKSPTESPKRKLRRNPEEAGLNLI